MVQSNHLLPRDERAIDVAVVSMLQLEASLDSDESGVNPIVGHPVWSGHWNHTQRLSSISRLELRSTTLSAGMGAQVSQRRSRRCWKWR